jgi:superfamily II DNA helicase RecQ
VIFIFYITIVMDFPVAIAQCAEKVGIEAWKPRQLDCLRAFWDRKDVLCVLPTGYGKSAIFQVLPFLRQMQSGLDQTPCAIIVTPINALMMDQCAKLTTKGIKACYLDFMCSAATTVPGAEPDADQETEEDDDDGPAGEVSSSIPLDAVPSHALIYAHPETLLCPKGLALVSKISQDVCAVVVDEAHCILEW